MPTRLPMGRAVALATLAILQACGGEDRIPSYAISGTVSGDASTGVTVTLSGASSATTTTDEAGAYSFGGLVNGTYVVTPSLGGYVFAPSSIEVTVNGADVSGQDFAATSPPDAPTGIEAFPGNGQATVSWTGSAQSYRVYYALTPTVTTSSPSVASSASPAVVPALANGTAYYFAVAGVNAAGEGPLSPVACAVPTPSNTAGLVLHDPLCGAVLSGRKWQAPGPYSFGVVDGAALLSVDAEDQEPRATRNANFESAVAVNAAGRRVTTLRADILVPAARLVRTGEVQVRAGVRLLYQPPAFRLMRPGHARDILLVDIGLVDEGDGLHAFRGVSHCDDPSCATRTTAGVQFSDPAGLVPIGAGLFHGAPAAYDTKYTVTVSLDETTGVFHWTIAGGSFSPGISGSADPSAYLAATPGWAGVPLAGSGFFRGQILVRSEDQSALGGGRGKVSARFDNVSVGFDGQPPSPFDDFDGSGPNSGPDELSIANWQNSGLVAMVPADGSLRMHQQATSVGTPAGFGHSLWLADPASFNTVQADVTIGSADGPSPQVILRGAFYNDGSSGSAPFSSVGDVWAHVSLQPQSNTAGYYVFRCRTQTCAGNVDVIALGTIPGVTVGTGLHTLRVRWSSGARTFRLSVDGVEVVVDPVPIAPVAGPANAPLRAIVTALSLPETTGALSSVVARVNNVFVGP